MISSAVRETPSAPRSRISCRAPGRRPGRCEIRQGERHIMQRKSGFLTFRFACCPAPGEMYLGYMKRGLSVIIAFWGLIFVASLLNMGILGILAPIIWAYSFFDTFNLRAQTPEQVAANPDAYLFDVESIAGSTGKMIVARRHNLFGRPAYLSGGDTFCTTHFCVLAVGSVPHLWAGLAGQYHGRHSNPCDRRAHYPAGAVSGKGSFPARGCIRG